MAPLQDVPEFKIVNFAFCPEAYKSAKKTERNIRGSPNGPRVVVKVLWKASFWSIFVLKRSGSTREASLQVPTKWGGAQPTATLPNLRSKMGV